MENNIKLLVLSDSHGRTGKLKNIIMDNSEADAIIFLGDGEDDFDDATMACGMSKYATVQRAVILQVRGNCDRMSMEQVTILHEFAGIKFYITHGFEQGVKYGLEEITTNAYYSECKVALFGHTHRQHLSENDGITLFNPGAVANGEYGLINIADGKTTFEHKSL